MNFRTLIVATALLFGGSFLATAQQTQLLWGYLTGTPSHIQFKIGANWYDIGTFDGSTFTVSSTITNAQLAAMAANTVKANATGASSTPTDVSLPSCSTSASALRYTSATGFDCNTAIAAPAASLTGSTLPAGITASSLTSLGASPTINTPIINQPIIVGITNGSGAAAGVVGEFMSSSIASGSAVSLTTGVTANVTSLSLTAGDWNCSGNINFYPAGGTTPSAVAGWISATSAAIPTRPNGGSFTERSVAMTIGGNESISVGQLAINISSTTTIYLEAYGGFSGSTMTAGGYIGCRRVR